MLPKCESMRSVNSSEWICGSKAMCVCAFEWEWKLHQFILPVAMRECLSPHLWWKRVINLRWCLCGINFHLSYLSAIIQVFAYLRDICIACFYELPVHIHCSFKKRIGLLVFFLFPGALNIEFSPLWYEFWRLFSSLSFVFWLFCGGLVFAMHI